MRTSKWSVCSDTSSKVQWSIAGNKTGRKSSKRVSKKRWSIGGHTPYKATWTIGDK